MRWRVGALARWRVARCALRVGAFGGTVAQVRRPLTSECHPERSRRIRNLWPAEQDADPSHAQDDMEWSSARTCATERANAPTERANAPTANAPTRQRPMVKP